MVCKEDVVTWFKELTSSKRIDVMCSLLNMCLPFELRFLGTCLEDLGKRDFHELRDTEIRANNSSELSDLQCMSDKRTQRKLALFLSLLKSCNHACSNGLYKILANFDISEINATNNSSLDENPLEELLLLYTLALNHPAFSYEQKAIFGNILVKLQDEESKMYSAKHQVGISLLYVKPPIQPRASGPSSEERQQQDIGVLGHCPGITIPPCHSAVGDANKGRSSVLSGLSVPPGLALAPEQLTATSYVHVAFPSPGHQPLPSVPWHSGVTPLVMSGMCATLPAEVQATSEVSPYPSSPLVSRQSSPSQSRSPSRTASPVRLQQQQPPVSTAAQTPMPAPDRSQNFSKSLASNRRGDRNGSHPNTAAIRLNCVDTSVAPPPTQQHRNISRKSSVETQDSFRETLVKEMPNYQNLQKYRIDELHRMRDEELKDLGLPNGAIMQLRSIMTKISSTNGLCGVDKREPVPNTGRRKLDGAAAAAEVEQPPERKTQSAGPIMRRYPSVPVEGGPVMYPQPPPHLLTTPQGAPCYTCFAVPVSSSAAPARYHGQAQPFYCLNHHLQTLHLDGDASHQGSNSSSASDSSSAGHSPPDTPSMPTAPHWDSRPYMGKETGGGERWSPGCDERAEKERRLPETSEKGGTVPEEGGNMHQQQPVQNSANSNASSRHRLTGGLGRSKTNPPGLQTLPRGRGPNPSMVILEGNHKTLPSCRRDGPAVNGAQVAPPPPRTSHPPPSHEDRKMFLVPSEMIQVSPHANVAYTSVTSTSQPPAPQYSGSSGGSNPLPRPADSSNVPYTPVTTYLPHAHYPALRTTGSLFPSFPPGSYIRPTYQYPNGELVYQYHGPQTPPPPPPTQFIPTPVVTYSTVVPPPKLSCYNCGSQNHHASDCKENTMEEMAKQGQYRLDYSPYQKTGECSSEK